MKRCYFCGTQATSYEHAPPKLMFRGFVCDSITVPSCESHNSHKSGADQAVVAGFLTPLRWRLQRPGVAAKLPPDVIRAVEIASKSFERAKRKAVPTYLLKNPPPQLADQPSVAFITPQVEIRAWIRQLNAAILYSSIRTHAHGTRWQEALVWSPSWVPGPSPQPLDFESVRDTLLEGELLKKELESLPWEAGWSAHPKPYPSSLYHFDVHFKSPGSIVVSHHFYGNYTWYVAISLSPKAVKAIKESCHPPTLAA